jgi:hypothetical protein
MCARIVSIGDSPRRAKTEDLAREFREWREFRIPDSCGFARFAGKKSGPPLLATAADGGKRPTGDGLVSFCRIQTSFLKKAFHVCDPDPGAMRAAQEAIFGDSSLVARG